VVTEPDGSAHLYYGSYYGGVQVRDLDVGALTTDPATATQVVIPNRYEGTFVVRRGGWYYLMGSATDCCRGPLTGYSVFAGRSRSPRGPFVDRLGVRLTASRVGGTPVISMNGNRWVGPGHNSVITDAAGQDWFAYHAIDRGDPYLDPPNPLNINRRPMLLDRLDWVGGWPSVRAGRWASDEPQPAPVTRAGGRPARPLAPLADDRPGRRLRGPSDDFDRRRLERGWEWVRAPAATLVPARGVLRFPVQDADIAEDPFDPAHPEEGGKPLASLLVRDLPRGDLLVEAKFSFDLPPDVQSNFDQAGIALYRNDDAFVKLAHVAIFETRQVEWAKEIPTLATPPGRRYGNTVIGPPAATTWLRIVRRGRRYTGYSSIDGRRWVRGGTWTHDLAKARLALFAMGGPGGHVAEFDYVRVSRPAR
jgi:arabinan endo-1,5-alpha-L-arabinosidase